MLNQIQVKKTILITIFTLTAVFAYSLTASAQENAKIVTVKMQVDRGGMVNINNLKLIDYNRKKVPNSLITKIEDAEGLQALRTLRPGMQLRYSYLREKPMIVKNKTIKVIYNVPGIQLVSDAQALQDGQKGDIIKIKNIKSNKILTAEVIKENTVKVK